MAEGLAANPEDYADWCKTLFFSLKDGGVWGVPRSGLVFERRGNALVLIDRMPYTAELAQAASDGHRVPPSPEALLAYQDQDEALIKEQFQRAGITVREAL